MDTTSNNSITATTTPPTFPGFTKPEKNYYPTPNNWIDICSEINNLSELKVIQYVLRHTWGFHEYTTPKTISVDEFMNGRKRDDGSRIDKGTGLSNRSVIDGLRLAENHNYLICTVDVSDRARVKKSYKLKMIESEEPSGGEDTTGGEDTSHLGEDTSHLGEDTSHLGYEDTSHRSEKYIRKTLKERHLKKNTINTRVRAPQKNASQNSLFPTLPGNEKPKRGKEKEPEQKKELTLPDLSLPATIETILQIGDFYRGKALPVSTRADSKYCKAKDAAEQLLSRPRRGGKKGYSLQEINNVFKLLLRRFDEEWMVDENWTFPVDVWVIANNIDAKLLLMERLKKLHPAQTQTEQGEQDTQGTRNGKTGRTLKLLDGKTYEVRYDLVLWTRLEPSDERLKNHVDYNYPQDLWDKNKLEIPWEWMTKEEALALNNGWSNGQRFVDYQLQQLINALYREKGIELEHHVQQYVDAEQEIA